MKSEKCYAIVHNLDQDKSGTHITSSTRLGCRRPIGVEQERNRTMVVHSCNLHCSRDLAGRQHICTISKHTHAPGSNPFPCWTSLVSCSSDNSWNMLMPMLLPLSPHLQHVLSAADLAIHHPILTLVVRYACSEDCQFINIFGPNTVHIFRPYERKLYIFRYSEWVVQSRGRTKE